MSPFHLVKKAVAKDFLCFSMSVVGVAFVGLPRSLSQFEGFKFSKKTPLKFFDVFHCIMILYCRILKK